MDASNSLVLETRDLSKAYKGVQALQDFNLTLTPGILGLLGPNGAGKSTLMRMLATITKPTEGTILWNGQDVVKDPEALRSVLGYLPQDFGVYPNLSAQEFLEYMAAIKGMSGKKAHRKISDLLDLVNLREAARRPLGGYSGGMRQRLGLTLAQVNYPELLILDEPAAALDPIGRHEVLQVMERLRAHATIFYSTHILDDVQQVSDTVAILNHGELVAQGPIEDLLAGGDKPVYTLSLKGDARRALARIEALPWVAGVREVAHNGLVTWEISVTDDQAAEAQLLGHVLAGEALTVVEFGRRKFELEEVFLSMVEGGTDGR